MDFDTEHSLGDYAFAMEMDGIDYSPFAGDPDSESSAGSDCEASDSLICESHTDLWLHRSVPRSVHGGDLGSTQCKTAGFQAVHEAALAAVGTDQMSPPPVGFSDGQGPTRPAARADGCAWLTVKGNRIASVSEAWTSLFGFEKDQVIGRTLRGLISGPGTDQSAFRECLKRAQHGRGSTVSGLKLYNSIGIPLTSSIEVTVV